MWNNLHVRGHSGERGGRQKGEDGSGDGMAYVKTGYRYAIKGLVTDKGPQRQWLWEIGKVEDPQCVCDEWTAQNAAHLQQWEMELGGQRSRCGMTRSGARKWWNSLRRKGGKSSETQGNSCK